MNEEKWKVINDFPNYSISSQGRVMSNKTGKLKKLMDDKDGYKVITLWIKQKPYFKRVNRLVAEAFIDNHNNYPIVNHKNEIKYDNRAENLEWCTVGYNNRYSKCRPVIQLSTDGEFVKEYASLQEAADTLGISNTHIQDCCSDKKVHCKTYKGYQWIYKENYNPQNNYAIDVPMKNRGKKVLQYDLNNNLIKVHEYLSKVEGYTRNQQKGISECCRGLRENAYGYIWRYEN